MTLQAPQAPAHGVQLSSAMADLAEGVRRSVVIVRGGPGSSGSGVVWDRPGLVITNHHVVPGPTALVVLRDDRRLPARVARRSAALDLVALEVQGDLPQSSRARVGDSAALRVGNLVLAVGNPMAERQAATLGIVSATPSDADGVLRLAIDLRPGNSGGALANARGEIVGIPHMVAGRGLGLAVPSRLVQQFLAAELDGTLTWV